MCHPSDGEDSPPTFHDSRTGKQLKPGLSKDWPNGERIIGFSADGKAVLCHRFREDMPPRRPPVVEVCVRTLDSGRQVVSFPLQPNHGRRLTDFAVSRDTLIAFGQAELGGAYDLKTGKHLGTFPSKGWMDSTSLSRDGRWLLTCRRKENVLHLWDARKPGKPKVVTKYPDDVEAVAISDDGRYCAAAMEWRAWVFDREEGQDVARAHTALHRPRHLQFTPDGKTLVGTGSGLHYGLMVWDWKTAKEQRGGAPASIREYITARDENPNLCGSHSSTSKPNLSADGRWLLSLCNHGETELKPRRWNLRPPKLLRKPREVPPPPSTEPDPPKPKR
ncbi:MAG: WD40 repeat domain-containing protein [Gemmataceae bacterium]|nr:WD40 repeat domain-containing protein [Gemmataceae bacterium]